MIVDSNGGRLACGVVLLTTATLWGCETTPAETCDLDAAGCRVDATSGEAGPDATADADADADADAACQCVAVPNAEPLFRTDKARSCNMASPLLHVTEDGEQEVLSVALDGLIRGFDAETGEERWSAQLEAPEGQTPIVLATPARVGDVLFLAWQNSLTQEGAVPDHGRWERRSHVVEAFNLTTHEPDPRWPRLTLTASKPAYDGGTVELQSRFQLLRSAVQHVEVSDREEGLLYVSLGNGPSLQPFHGWVFELDLDEWRAGGVDAAVSGVLLTTRENECEASGRATGAMVCGGGVWTPGGVLISDRPDDSYEIFVPTGNGRVDYGREAYAHSVMRTGRGLGFEPGCDEAACQDFDEFSPDHECLESCENVFSARLPEGDVYEPEHDLCDGMTFMECYGELDADLGSSSPVEAELENGPRVLVQPGKDGALYLLDAAHLGRLYDREQVLVPCGTTEEPCPAIWTGNFVTTPVVTRVDGDPLVIVSGFNFDSTHWAGVLAYRVVMEGDAPVLRKAWQVPEADDQLDFRYHTGRPLLFDFEDEAYIALVEPSPSQGWLWIIRAADGAVIQRRELQSSGLKYTQPLLVDDRLYVGTCRYGALEDGAFEAFRLVPRGFAGEPLDAGAPEPDGGPVEGEDICEPGGIRCDGTQYCERDRCGGPGICHPRPDSCESAEPDAVCGCDGKAYASECHARAEGVTVDPDGDC